MNVSLRGSKPKKAEGTDRKPKNKNGDKSAEVMVECAKCGTFISSKEALIKDGRYYCSKECAEL